VELGLVAWGTGIIDVISKAVEEEKKLKKHI